MALETGKYAKNAGVHHEWHGAVFKAYFTDCKNIGNLAVLRGVAQEAGLSMTGLEASLRRAPI